MKRKGMWADFTEEDIELMVAIRREEEERARKAARRPPRVKGAANPRVVEPAPDRRTVSKSRPPRPPKSDPLRYGWRYVPVKGPDGTVTEQQVPLTEEDVLFPKPGDYIVQTNPHDDDVSYLKAVSKARRKHDRTTAVLSDCRVDWNLPGVRPLGPDLAVFTGVARDEGWETFNVRAEGAHPLLVLEETSRATLALLNNPAVMNNLW